MNQIDTSLLDLEVHARKIVNTMSNDELSSFIIDKEDEVKVAQMLLRVALREREHRILE